MYLGIRTSGSKSIIKLKTCSAISWPANRSTITSRVWSIEGYRWDRRCPLVSTMRVGIRRRAAWESVPSWDERAGMFQTGSKIILAPNYGCHQKSVLDQYMWLTSTYSSNNQLLAVVVSPLDFFHLDTKSRSSKSSSSLLSLANLIASKLGRMERTICMPWSQVACVCITYYGSANTSTISNKGLVPLHKPQIQ